MRGQPWIAETSQLEFHGAHRAEGTNQCGCRSFIATDLLVRFQYSLSVSAGTCAYVGIKRPPAKTSFLIEFADLTFALQIREVAAVANIKPTPPGGQIQTALNGSLVSPAGGFRSTLPAAATAFKGAITLTSHAPCSAGELGDGSFRFQDPQGLEANPSGSGLDLMFLVRRRSVSALFWREVTKRTAERAMRFRKGPKSSTICFYGIAP